MYSFFEVCNLLVSKKGIKMWLLRQVEGGKLKLTIVFEKNKLDFDRLIWLCRENLLFEALQGDQIW